MSDLFRREAIAHQSQRLHGAILLTRTWRYPALCLFLACLVGAIVIFALCFGFTRKETISGMIVPDRGLIGLVAPQAGIVAAISVREGQHMAADEVLLVLSSERASALGGTQSGINTALASRTDSLRSELNQLQRQASNKTDEQRARLANLHVSMRLLDGDIAIRRQQVQRAQEAASRFAGLADDGAVSRGAAQEKQSVLADSQSRLGERERERVALRRAIDDLGAASIDLPLQTARDSAHLRRNMDELTQQATESEAQREILVRASQAGQVAGIVVDPGQAVVAQQRVASLVPAGSVLEAELYAPTRAAGFVHVGTEVLLRYDAFPYQKFGQFRGRVREVSLNAIPLQDLHREGQGAGTAASEPHYRIRVRLEQQAVNAGGAARALRPGMQLSASLILEKRTLAEWVLAPLFAVTGRL